MSKLRLKSKMTLYLFIILTVVTMTSCQGTKKETKLQNTKKNLPLSELVDWKQEKVISNLDDYKPALVMNDAYVFYATAKRKVIRVNRKTKKKKMIIQLEKLREPEYSYLKVGFQIVGNTLYLAYDGALYQYDFDGHIQKCLYTYEDLSKTIDMSPEIWGFQIYKEKACMLFSGQELGIVDLKTKKTTILVDYGCYDYCVYQDYLYFLQKDTYGIQRVNLKTLKKEYIRGEEGEEGDHLKDVMLYHDLYVKNEKLYYTCSKGMYEFQENGKDKWVKETIVGTSEGNDYGWFGMYGDEKTRYMEIYNFKTRETKKIQCPEDMEEIGFVDSDMVLYRKSDDGDDSQQEDGQNYYAFSMLKVE